MTTFLYSLRKNAAAINEVILSSLASQDSLHEVSVVVDYENGRELDNTRGSRVFKKGTNFPETVRCQIGAKVMFLTNSMLDQGISNRTCGIVTELRSNGEPNVAFPTQDGIRVRLPVLMKCTVQTNTSKDSASRTRYELF
jgi:hypothetical protein